MKKIIALMAALQLFMNVPVLGLVNVEAASAYAYQDALIPIEAFATAIAIGSGIVASQSQAAVDGASEMLRKAVASMKAKACLDSETEFRVIDGGKPRKPKKGDDKNNRKWFTIAAGSVATGSLIAGLKASREMMQSIYDVNGYELIKSNANSLINKSDLINEAGVNGLRSQLSQYPYKGFLRAFDNFVNYLNSNNIDFSNSIFMLIRRSPTGQNNVYTTETPSCKFYMFNIDNVEYLDGSGSFYTNDLQVWTPSVSTNYSFMCPRLYGSFNGSFMDSYDMNASVKYRAFEGGDTFKELDADKDLKTASYSNFYNPYYCDFYAGVQTYVFHNYKLTNQIYNNSQTQQANFPDWLQQSIETLNGNLTGLNLAINNLQLPQNWNDTQTNIQTGTAPSNIINQYINNWSNPDQAPDPEPDPGPNPDPEPEPDPGPGDQPAAEAAVEESGKDLFDWAMKKVTLPDGFFDKLPFSIPYDIYLLLKSMFPTGKSARSVYSVRSNDVSDTNPNSITVSSNYEASGISTRTHSNKWVRTAPIINIDLHWKYHGVDGIEKSIDIVKKVDLSSISYFAMIIYISIYIFWFFLMLSWIMSSFKG